MTCEIQVCKTVLLKAWGQIIFPMGAFLQGSCCSEVLRTPAQLRFLTQSHNHFLHPFTPKPLPWGSPATRRAEHICTTADAPGGTGWSQSPMPDASHTRCTPCPQLRSRISPEHPRRVPRPAGLSPGQEPVWTTGQSQPERTSPCPVVR